MAHIQLENNLGVTLQRVLFTGRAYTVEPPATIPPNARVFWQADDSGAVTYSAQPAGTSATALTAGEALSSLRAAPSAPASAATAASVSPSAFPLPAPAATITQPPATGPQHKSRATHTRQLTLAWTFAAGGRPAYLTEHADASMRVRRREQVGGVLYVVSPRHRRHAPHAPHLPRRRSRLVGVLSLIAALLIVASTGVASAAVYAKTGSLPFGLRLPVTTTPHISQPGSASAKPQLALTASQTSAFIGTSVTLTASLEGPFRASGYQIDIFNIASALAPVNAAPCAADSPCRAAVTSASPTTMTYLAYVERGLRSGVMASSNGVTVTWTPSPAHNGPTIVTLAARPGPDSSGIVRVMAGTTVTLTASTDRPVEDASFQITIVDRESGSPVPPTPCTKGTACSAQVSSTAPISRTFIARAAPGSQSSGQLASSPITVTWSAAPPPPPSPPSPPKPPNVTLSSNPTSGSGGTVNVTIGAAVTLTATASAAVDNSGYYIQLNNDTTGTQVGNSCTHGTSCSATVQSGSPATYVYKGYIVQSSRNQIVVVSSPITVIWSLPPPPTGITLAVSDPYPNDGEQVTLTATTQGGVVTNTGYSIQLVDVTDGDVILCQTGNGSTCVAYQTNSEVAITYEAYVDQGDPHSPLRDSGPVTVQWSHTIYIPPRFPRPMPDMWRDVHSALATKPRAATVGAGRI